MGFASSISHLDGDEIDIPFLVVPRPNSSILYTVPAPRPDLYLTKGDYLVVERDRAMRTGKLMLITVGGEFRLAEIRREHGRFAFEGMPDDAFDSDIEVFGVATRVIRMLEGNAGAAGSPGLRDRRF